MKYYRPPILLLACLLSSQPAQAAPHPGYYAQYQQELTTLAGLESQLAPYLPIQAALEGEQGHLATIESDLAPYAIPELLTGRDLATANPALTNSFNAQRTRDGLEAMNVFSETAMRLVGDLYQPLTDAVSQAERALAQARASGDATQTAAAQTQLETARAALAAMDGERIALHGLVGGLTALLGGADPVSGLVGGASGKLATLEMEKLIASRPELANHPVVRDALLALSATAAGSITGGSTGGYVGSQGDRFNRQLHPRVQSFLTNPALVRKWAEKRGISEEAAQQELYRSAAALNDRDWAALYGEQTGSAIKTFLLEESVGLRLDDGSGYFTPNQQDYNNFDKYARESTSGGGYARYATWLAVNDSATEKALEHGHGQMSGVKQAAKNLIDGLKQYPERIADAREQIGQLLASSPAEVLQAVRQAAAALPEAVRAEFEQQMALYDLHSLYGRHDKAAEIYTVAMLGMFDPGKKGTAVLDALGKTVKELDAVKKAADNASGREARQAYVTGQRPDGRTVYQVGAGRKGEWERAVNGQLKPNAAYELSNGHAYLTDDNGRVSAVEGKLSRDTLDRNGHQQCVAGKCGNAGDEGGHLIAASLGGAGDRINLVPQSALLNRGDYRSMENELRDALKAGKEVSVKIELGYPEGAGKRPSEFRVLATIDGKIQPYKFTQ